MTKNTSARLCVYYRILCFLLAASVVCLDAYAQNGTSARLERSDWNPDVKTALNDLLNDYGIDSKAYDKNSYVVFDFDNTSAIFDVEEQLCAYQLETMAFALEPSELMPTLLTDLTDPSADLTKYGYIKGSYSDLFADISDAYGKLWDKYGPFTPEGLREDKLAELHADPLWLEFAAKMRASYDLVCDVETHEVAYPWIVYWFSGMTEDEVYALSKRSCEKYGKLETTKVVWESPADLTSRVGVVKAEWTSGVSVTENIKELWAAFQANGIDVWVCSASASDAVRAAVDVFGLHSACKGLLGMTVVLDSNGKYCNAYDYQNGRGYYCNSDGTWTKMDRPEKTQTEGVGKSVAILNAIAPEYSGKGPLAGFMDSTGDFNFCTEFSSMKLAVCFNRANRKLTDGGGLIAIVALYEKETLGYDLRKAAASGDTLYVLQGRDENGLRTFRPDVSTLRLGASEPTTLVNEDSYAALKYLSENKISVRDFLNTHAIKRNAEDNVFHAKSGFLGDYLGYRTR